MARRKNGAGAGEAPSASDDPNLLSLIAAGLHLRPGKARDGAEIWRIGGNTLAHRDALREAGGTWNRIEQVWEFAGDDPTASVARALAARPAAAGHNSREAAERPHYHGHRQRVRDRALGSGLDGFQDYERSSCCCSTGSSASTPSRSPRSCWSASAPWATSRRRG